MLSGIKIIGKDGKIVYGDHVTIEKSNDPKLLAMFNQIEKKEKRHYLKLVSRKIHRV